MRLNTGFIRVLMLGTLLFLPACATLDGAMTDIRNATGNFKMPTFARHGQPEAVDVAHDEKALAAAAMTEIATPVECPRVDVVDELSSLHQFVDGNNEAAGAISSVTITAIDSLCSINEQNVVVDMDIIMQARLGPRAKAAATDKPSFSYPYFIAITTPSGDISAREVFAATIAYDADEESLTHNEKMRQVIPLTGDYSPRQYEIMVGFQLSPAELAYNRAAQ